MRAQKLLERWNNDPSLQAEWAAFWNTTDAGRRGFELLREMATSPARITGTPEMDAAQFCFLQGSLKLLENIRTLETVSVMPQPLPKEWEYKTKPDQPTT